MRAAGRLSPEIVPHPEAAGVRIVDPIEHRQYSLLTSDPVDPDVVSTDEIRYPVDAAATVRTDRLSVGELVNVFVHDGGDTSPAEILPGSETSFEPGRYHVELNAAIKLYLRIEGPFTVDASATELRFDLDGSTRVVVGARSYHDRPATTITVPDRPEAAMEAVSTFGAALKTTSPERAYPTLRGHPPAIERGSRLDVPDGLEPPETGVWIEVPPEYEYVLVSAPLAYYLGATVRPGDRPRLRTSAGVDRPLGGPDRPFASAVERLLKRTFLLDCLVRTEGFYAVELAERAAIEPAVELDFPALYDAPIAERIARYLEVPYGTIAPNLPQWALTAHFPPEPAGLVALPYVCNDLAVVRAHRPPALDPEEIRERLLDGYAAPDDGLRSSDGRRSPDGFGADVVAIEPTGSVDDAWFGESVPLGATMGLPRAYRNRFDRALRQGDIEIAVVSNDAQMAEEGSTAADVYGSRADLDFDVTLAEDVDRESLYDLLSTDLDFLHYVGHISADGFRCSDGFLDADGLDGGGPDVFLLNGCESFRQGRHLVAAGSVGGVATSGDVVDSGAAAVGLTVARLLNQGFPLRSALTLARRESIVGQQYVVVGDGNAEVAATRAGAPIVCRVESPVGGRYGLTIRTYLPLEAGMGATVSPTLEGRDEHYLAPGRIEVGVTADDLRRYLEWHPYPVEIDGELVWEDRFEAVRDRFRDRSGW